MVYGLFTIAVGGMNTRCISRSATKYPRGVWHGSQGLQRGVIGHRLVEHSSRPATLSRGCAMQPGRTVSGPAYPLGGATDTISFDYFRIVHLPNLIG